MKVSLSWLKKYIAVDLEPEVISEKLTMAGLEVDSVEDRFDYLDNVVVGQVKACTKHPNADKLTCCKVDVGQGNLLDIVCGAPNVKEGMSVACALPGAVLPGDFKIKKSKLRGEKSEGMLCSAAELRLSDDKAGIMDLDGNIAPGTPLEKGLDLSDTVFEIDLTPNRPDCLSMIGVAREVAAFNRPKGELHLPDFSLPQKRISDQSIHDYASVEIIDTDLCPRYTAGLIFDVKIGPSPIWLQQMLESVGLTPVNNVVDITNFVMHETGQPLHAFDFDLVSKGQIIVKRAGSDIKFTTLDSKEHILEPDMLMICDGERPVALAGVMGGENSEIIDTTTRVLVESAYFNPISIRRTAKKTGIATDASHRFERGVDPLGSLNALNRAVALIAEVCDATIAMDVIDAHPLKPEPVVIDLNTNALNIRLGTNFSSKEIQEFLESVEFDVTLIGDTHLKAVVPSFRVDVSRPEDFSEEVARLWGYNNIETSYPMVPAKGKMLAPRIMLREKIRQAMTGFSFFEAINYNFINVDSTDKLQLLEDDKRRKSESILNPISEQMSVLRTSLIPGLLETMKRNNSQQIESLNIFEIGKVFFATGEGELPEEKEMVGGLMTGLRSDKSWHSKKSTIDFFDMKGVLEEFLKELCIEDITYSKIEDTGCPYYENGYAAYVKKNGEVIGTFGKVVPQVLKNFSLKQDAYVFDIDLATLENLLPQSINAQPLPKFPSISRDTTIIVDTLVEVGAILDEIKKIAKKEALIEDVFLFDVFAGAPLKEKKKSLSFRMVYRSSSKTLKEKNIKELHAKISESLLEKFKGDLPE
ncbi:MAG: phenylalanine--tRNA ligase subunit beta [Desulfobacteraceae bacterium]|nr:phenylalanine--tRNA ligase subunit beta [Desulfobacteraceae bacterium]